MRVLRCPQRMCDANWPLTGNKDDDERSIKLRAKHTTHSWPLWSMVTAITWGPDTPVRLVRYVGKWVGQS